MTKVYGIKNCDTIKKALAWLDTREISYDFHDYKKEGVDETVLQRALEIHGWDTVINKRGTTWRKLADDVKAAMDDTAAIAVAMENPSIIKRPLLITENEIYLGFSDSAYQDIFENE